MWIEIKFFVKYWNICGGSRPARALWIEIVFESTVHTLLVVEAREGLVD